MHAPHRGAPGFPAAAPRDGQRPLPAALQRTLQPGPQLGHGHAKVTATAMHGLGGGTGGGGRVRRDSRDNDRAERSATEATANPRAPPDTGGGGVTCQKLTVTANNNRNVQHLSHPVHRYSLKNVYT